MGMRLWKRPASLAAASVTRRERPGSYRWQAVDCPEISGSFFCTESEEPGYVQVSQKDPRYFAWHLRRKLCAHRPQRLHSALRCSAPRRRAFCHWRSVRDAGHFSVSPLVCPDAGRRGELYTTVAFLRLSGYPNPLSGRHDLAKFHRLDTVMELAREYGIRVKLCLEHFRCFWPVA